MEEIAQLLDVLSRRELKAFVHYLDTRNKRRDAVNISLLKAILSNETEVLKAKMGSNAFHVAKKRLSDNLLDFVASRTLENEATDEGQVIKYLVIARKLFHHRKYLIAYKILSKAKLKAKAIQHYTLLNEIYHLQIQYSANYEALDLEELITEFNLNRTKIEQFERNNIALAVLKKGLKTQSKSPQNVTTLLENYQKSVQKSNLSEFNYKELYQLIKVIDTVGFHQRNYAAISIYFLDRLSELKDSEQDNEVQLPYHIRILYLISNIYFRKKQFSKSLSYLAEMENQMLRYKSKYYELFQINYITLKALNLNFTNQPVEAENLLDTLLLQNKNKTNKLFPLLIRSMIHFQQNELKKATELFSTFQKSDKYYLENIGMEWLLSKKFMEILLHIELNNIDLADSKISNFIRNHQEFLAEQNSSQIIPFLQLIKMVYHSPHLANTKQFKEKVENSIQWKPREQEDLFLMCFYAWLKSKMNNKDLYTTTLELFS